MTTHAIRRPCALAAIVAVFCGLAASVAAGVETPVPAVPRVRSDSPTIATAIHDATERSTTFRSLVETIQATDGLVYVREGRCGRSVRNCLALSIVVSGPFRLLHVLIDARAPVAI